MRQDASPVQPQNEPTARLLALPVQPCERCGDAMIAGLTVPICVPCVRRRELRRRLEPSRGPGRPRLRPAGVWA